jgi:hypothetical protein
LLNLLVSTYESGAPVSDPARFDEASFRAGSAAGVPAGVFVLAANAGSAGIVTLRSGFIRQTIFAN